jgi:hypothetical protein
VPFMVLCSVGVLFMVSCSVRVPFIQNTIP